MRIFAYTAPFSPLPEYLNVTPMDNGSTILTIRSQGANATSKINLPPQQLKEMGEWFLARAAELEGSQ